MSNNEQEIYLVVREVLQQYNLIFEALREVERESQGGRENILIKIGDVREQMINHQAVLQKILTSLEQLERCTEGNNTDTDDCIQEIKTAISNLNTKMDNLIVKVLIVTGLFSAGISAVILLVDKIMPSLVKMFN